MEAARAAKAAKRLKTQGKPLHGRAAKIRSEADQSARHAAFEEALFRMTPSQCEERVRLAGEAACVAAEGYIPLRKDAGAPTLSVDREGCVRTVVSGAAAVAVALVAYEDGLIDKVRSEAKQLPTTYSPAGGVRDAHFGESLELVKHFEGWTGKASLDAISARARLSAKGSSTDAEFACDTAVTATVDGQTVGIIAGAKSRRDFRVRMVHVCTSHRRRTVGPAMWLELRAAVMGARPSCKFLVETECCQAPSAVRLWPSLGFTQSADASEVAGKVRTAGGLKSVVPGHYGWVLEVHAADLGKEWVRMKLM